MSRNIGELGLTEATPGMPSENSVKLRFTRDASPQIVLLRHRIDGAGSAVTPTLRARQKFSHQ